MKTLISFAVGVIFFILALGWAGDLINWIVSGIPDLTFRAIMKIVMWLVCLSGIVGISISIGVGIAAIVKSILGK